MQFRLAKIEELDGIMDIYRNARIFMANAGNPDQWGDEYPAKEHIRADIQGKGCYVAEQNGKILGVCYYAVAPDATYAVIDGKWLNDRPYGVVHRIAVLEQGKGVALRMIEECFARCKNLRIDTHEKNLPMRRLLNKLGFLYCGVIRVADGTERIAFMKTE